MSAFSIAIEREHLLAPYGVQRLLGASIDQARENASIASHALSCVREGVLAALCSLDGEASRLFSRSRNWLHIAIEEKEPTRFANYDEANRLLMLALCDWLFTGTLDNELAQNACDHFGEHLKNQTDKSEVAHALPSFVIAERYHELVEHFTRCKNLTCPKSLRSIKCPGKMSLLFAEHALTGRPDRATLSDAYTAFLKYQLPVCLGIRSQGLGITQDVPKWLYLEWAFFQSDRSVGVHSLRRVFEYVEKEE